MEVSVLYCYIIISKYYMLITMYMVGKAVSGRI